MHISCVIFKVIAPQEHSHQNGLQLLAGREAHPWVAALFLPFPRQNDSRPKMTEKPETHLKDGSLLCCSLFV